MSSQFSPTDAPRFTNTVFQINVPTVVKSKNNGIPILLIPAGIEIKLRINGINRQKNTVHGPYLLNHAYDLSTSSVVSRSHFPYLTTIRFIRSAPNILPR